jgi:2-methylisocitrate lyase-like PEP mutase family enzyme
MNNNNYYKFQSLHTNEVPLILYNCWNVQTAIAIENVGAEAIATSSFAIADSLGYDDGEQIPFECLLEISSQIIMNTSLPLSVDLETGYSSNTDQLLANIFSLLKIGVVGINLEDRIIGAPNYTLESIAEHSKKIKRICDFVEEKGYKLFINARTDIFLMESVHKMSHVKLALERCNAYHQAGAKSIFVPGLTDINLIKHLVDRSSLPVNIMLSEDSPSVSELSTAGVKRISYGPTSYFNSGKDFEKRAGEIYGNNK